MIRKRANPDDEDLYESTDESVSLSSFLSACDLRVRMRTAITTPRRKRRRTRTRLLDLPSARVVLGRGRARVLRENANVRLDRPAVASSLLRPTAPALSPRGQELPTSRSVPRLVVPALDAAEPGRRLLGVPLPKGDAVAARYPTAVPTRLVCHHPSLAVARRRLHRLPVKAHLVPLVHPNPSPSLPSARPRPSHLCVTHLPARLGHQPRRSASLQRTAHRRGRLERTVLEAQRQRRRRTVAGRRRQCPTLCRSPA